jgi:hypothetical protein
MVNWRCPRGWCQLTIGGAFCLPAQFGDVLEVTPHAGRPIQIQRPPCHTEQVTGGTAGRRVVVGVLLAVIFLTCTGWLVLSGAAPRGLLVMLLLGASLSLAALAAFYLPDPLPTSAKRGIGVGLGCATLLIGFLAIPGVREGSATRTASPTTSQASTGADSPTREPAGATPTPSADERPPPFTAKMGFDSIPRDCEPFVIDKSILNRLPDWSNFDAEWVYAHGGATDAGAWTTLAVQGTTDQAVILQGFEIVDLEAQRAHPNSYSISTCNPFGGRETNRYFDLILNPKHRQVIARPAYDPGDTGKIEQAVDFPFRISSSDPEYFVFNVTGPSCVCSWRLAINWTSGGRSGQMKVDRGFSKIVTDTRSDLPGSWWSEDGRFFPPLPTG